MAQQFFAQLMGLGESKELNQELELFPTEEREILKDNFTKLSGGSKKIDRQTLQNAVKQILPKPEADIFAQRICDLMTGQIATNNTVTIEGYIHCAAVMNKGMLEDKATQLMYLAKGRKGDTTFEECFNFSIQIIRLTFEIIRHLPAFRSWDGHYICNLEEDSVKRLATAIMNELEKSDSESIDNQAVSAWLSKSGLLIEFFGMMSHHIFQFPMTKGKSLIPLCRGIPAQVYPSWLSLSDILFINCALPSELRSEWRFLFSSRIHGESFSSLMGNIIDKGPSVVFIKDFDGNIFGGFASTSWTVGPQFKGTKDNFVFSLAPQMAIYNTTGFNDHYQYLNLQQQTFPNGMGMGGQLDYFAIWVDSEYGKGKCSPSCTTFSCHQLSGKPEFSIDMIEVWAVGPEPTEDEDETEARPSILDVDVEGKAMLRMLNRGPVSEGMRENPTSDDPEEKELYVSSVSSQ
ncbi:MTOR-associated protein MEAK7-like isoform X1 [Daphnia pulicaria]|uniref:MTOR-associated protein MEAK7-like isoform X1 n=2 Tax=Daphnia pulicaria TaxID=35523 RepID=UPI001EEA527E|nr:MTOR-associated protein MEAK7-like isoform X1 [Daphnia pulicaria]XP_046638818.1 MTOR-associated protein MEAK7-like isoform X1 [Daphnia pulicaria]XP_046638819.1 MTOR-associated protein MEAK7-like isoform X1 [Daphnia pulicaria]